MLGDKIDKLTPEEQADHIDEISLIASNYRYLKHYEQSIHFSYLAQKVSKKLDPFNPVNIPYCFCQLERYKDAYKAYNAALDYIGMWARKTGLRGGKVSEHPELQEIADILTKQGYKVLTEVEMPKAASSSSKIDTFFEVVSIVNDAVKRDREEKKRREMLEYNKMLHDKKLRKR